MIGRIILVVALSLALSVPTLAEETEYLGVRNAGKPTNIIVDRAITRSGRALTIKDETGNARTNNITINFSGGETADGHSTLTITTDGGWVTLQPRSDRKGYAIVNWQL